MAPTPQREFHKTAFPGGGYPQNASPRVYGDAGATGPYAMERNLFAVPMNSAL